MQWEAKHKSVARMQELEEQKWDKWEQKSGNKKPESGNKVGTKWEQERETKWEQEPQSGTRMGTKWEQSGNKNPKVGQEWEQSGNKNPKVGTRMGTKWKQSWNLFKNPKVPRRGELGTMSSTWA